ncbi:MAG TPA: ATP-binding cassette domain-containing protein, partial [Steroidobacteraceae bacterium]
MLPTLSIDELKISFSHRTQIIEAVDRVSLAIAPSECLGIVGESGSGKTQVFMAAMGLLSGNAKVSGSV